MKDSERQIHSQTGKGGKGRERQAEERKGRERQAEERKFGETEWDSPDAGRDRGEREEGRETESKRG